MQKESVKEENVNSSAGVNPSGSENQVYVIRKKTIFGDKLLGPTQISRTNREDDRKFQIKDRRSMGLVLCS